MLCSLHFHTEKTQPKLKLQLPFSNVSSSCSWIFQHVLCYFSIQHVISAQCMLLLAACSTLHMSVLNFFLHTGVPTQMCSSKYKQHLTVYIQHICCATLEINTLGARFDTLNLHTIFSFVKLEQAFSMNRSHGTSYRQERSLDRLFKS